jgi:pimeloyl-[acyl-carrier protein] methyl ester esterase
LDIAHRYPDRVNSLILLAGNPLFVSLGQWSGVNPNVLDTFAANLTANCQATLLRFLSLQVNGLSDSKTRLKELKAAIIECNPPDNDSLQGGLEILKRSDLREVLVQLTIPVSVILGDKDTLVPVAVGQQMQNIQPKLELTILERAGHVPFLSHAQELLTLICRFIDKPCR